MKKRQDITAKIFDKSGNLLAIGRNNYVKSHPVQAYWAERVGQPQRIFLHAEIAAIIQARGKAMYKIRIERYSASGEPKMACPCAVCQLAIKQAGIKVIEYTVG